MIVRFGDRMKGGANDLSIYISVGQNINPSAVILGDRCVILYVRIELLRCIEVF